MQNLIQRYKDLDKALLFLRNQAFCLKIWKLWRALTTLQFTHISYLPASTKGCVEFLFCLDLELFANIKKDLVSTHSFYTLINNSRSKQNQKNPAHLFGDITK